MPCALPPVDQSVAQLGWGHGTFLGPSGAGVRPVNHTGIDFMADTGSPVVAAWGGTVVGKGHQPFGGASGFMRDALGHYVVLSHGVVEVGQNPVWTRYANLRAESPLVVGQRVAPGDLVGYVGTSGLAPESVSRPRLFFQVFTHEAGATNPRSPGTDPLSRFFSPLGVAREGGETPGMPITPYERVPAWGGRLVQVDACATSGMAGLRGIDPRRQRPLYERYGQTRLSSTSRYAPAAYEVTVARSAGGGGLLALVAGAVGARWLWGSR